MLILCAIVCVSIMSVTGLPALEREESSENEVPTYDFPYVPRSQWHAREAKGITNLKTPVPYIVIHHSYTPKACYNTAECGRAMRSMQNFHMDDRNWWDIGYNFGVGSDGVVYEGRGWTLVGAHALHFNTVSIGIVLIGDWNATLPTTDQLKTTKSLIASGVELGYVKPEYKLVGHRQVRETECPGNALFEEIETWSHYSKHPSSVKELKYVVELPERVKDLLNGN